MKILARYSAVADGPVELCSFFNQKEIYRSDKSHFFFFFFFFFFFQTVEYFFLLARVISSKTLLLDFIRILH